jgi:hypothetical protein
MKKNVLLIGLVFITLSLNAQKFWNFTDEIWEAKSYTTPTVIDGLSINPSSSGAIDIDANGKSIDGYTFTKRLKLGGAGTPTADGRNVSFAVTGACKIIVYGMASSSGATDRSLLISDGATEPLFSEILLGDKIYKKEYDYAGGAATLYLYSSSSGLNFYGIKVETIGAGIKDINATKEIKSVEHYDLTGKKVDENTAVKGSILIEKTIYIDGTSSDSKIIK